MNILHGLTDTFLNHGLCRLMPLVPVRPRIATIRPPPFSPAAHAPRRAAHAPRPAVPPPSSRAAHAPRPAAPPPSPPEANAPRPVAPLPAPAAGGAACPPVASSSVSENITARRSTTSSLGRRPRRDVSREDASTLDNRSGKCAKTSTLSGRTGTCGHSCLCVFQHEPLRMQS